MINKTKLTDHGTQGRHGQQRHMTSPRSVSRILLMIDIICVIGQIRIFSVRVFHLRAAFLLLLLIKRTTHLFTFSIRWTFVGVVNEIEPVNTRGLKGSPRYYPRNWKILNFSGSND